jgi:hypothetical protein|tara:strand:- start:4037 stop:4570 length:534 start_codon:yes stop_codon:yes gene_type:complete
METKNVERYLNSFGKQVVNRAKANLGKAKGGSTKLAQTIKFEVDSDADGFVVKFYMANYGTFLDKGVSGNKKKQSYKNYENQTESSPYSYTTKQPPPDILSKWIKKKGIKGRDKKSGRFISNLSLAFIIGRAIKRDGIKSLSFFQKPLGLGMKQFGKDLLGAITTDITDSISTTKVN